MAFSTGRMSQVEPHFAVFFDFEREYQATENALAKIKSVKMAQILSRPL